MENYARRIVGTRWILALTLGATAFATVFAFAASLTVTSGGLGAGNAAVTSCDTDGVNTSHGVTYAATTGYKVTTVTVTNIGVNGASANGACAGKSMRVQLTGASNASLGEKTVTLASPGTGSDSQVDFTANDVAASSVTGVHVVISG
ncbi:MAG: hypothetical protein ICV64_02070 [Thermoleophilia bacterium]|nr:hypothetical protein [Thermoleophilia bacterium]